MSDSPYSQVAVDEQKILVALADMDVDLRRNPYGYALAPDELQGWAIYMANYLWAAGHDEVRTEQGREMLVESLIIEMFTDGLPIIAQGYDTVAGDEHVGRVVDVALGALDQPLGMP